MINYYSPSWLNETTQTLLHFHVNDKLNSNLQSSYRT